jgi:hypothetical protein
MALIAASLAVCVPASALASSHASKSASNAGVNCGGSGVNSLYCIPQQSVFTFTHVAKAAHCSIRVGFTVEPKIEGLRGHAHITLKGLSGKVHRIARPSVEGGPYSVTFAKLRAGAYRLTGWYEGDGTRLASTHRTLRLVLSCGQ